MIVGNSDEATGTTVNSEWTLMMSKFCWILSTGPVEMKMPCMDVVSSFQIPGCLAARVLKVREMIQFRWQKRPRCSDKSSLIARASLDYYQPDLLVLFRRVAFGRDVMCLAGEDAAAIWR